MHEESGGVMTVNQNGNVSLFTIYKQDYVKYIRNVIGDHKLGVMTACRYNLPGAEDAFKTRFEQLMSQGQYQQAAKLAADAPQDILRTSKTMKQFQSVPNINGNPSADLQYFTFLLQKGPLNKAESIGLCQSILQFRPQQAVRKIEQFLRAQ